MAKIVGDGQGDVRRSFKGAAYVRQHRGQTLLVAMPTRQKKQKSEKQLAAMDLMRQRSLAVKAMAPELVYWSSRFAKGTALMPRDWLFMAMAGRYVLAWMPEEYITGPYARDGIEGENNGQEPITPDSEMPTFDKLRNLYPMAALNDLSFLFDIYGDTPGTIFYRTKDGWRGLPPGVPGTVLTLMPDGTLQWQAAQSGGSAISIGVAYGEAFHSGYTSTYCQFFNPAMNMAIHGVFTTARYQAGKEYQAACIKRDGNFVSEVLGRTDTFLAPENKDDGYYYAFPDPVEIHAGEEFGLCHTIINGTTTERPLPAYRFLVPGNLPLRGKGLMFRWESALPSPGDLMTDLGYEQIAVMPAWANLRD